MYRLVVLGSESMVRSPDADRFFNSFAVLSPEFREFSPPGCHFKVEMPPNPTEKHLSVPSGPMVVFKSDQIMRQVYNPLRGVTPLKRGVGKAARDAAEHVP